MYPLSKAEYFAPPELQSSLGSWFYKHLVPPGPKTRAGRKPFSLYIQFKLSRYSFAFSRNSPESMT
jgi:hypothetical protein